MLTTGKLEPMTSPARKLPWWTFVVPGPAFGLSLFLLKLGPRSAAAGCSAAIVVLIMTLWWGPRVIPAVVVTSIVFGTLSGLSLQHALLLALPHATGALAAIALIRLWDVDVALRGRRDLALVFAFGILLPSLLSGAHRSAQNMSLGRVGADQAASAYLAEWASSLAVFLFLGLPLLRFVTPRLQARGWTRRLLPPSPAQQRAPAWHLLGKVVLFGLAVVLPVILPARPYYLLLALPVLVSALAFGLDGAIPVVAATVLSHALAPLFGGVPGHIPESLPSTWTLPGDWAVLVVGGLGVVAGQVVSELREQARRVGPISSSLKKREDLISALVDNMPAVVFIKDREGRYSLVNRELERIAWPREEMLGQRDIELYPAALAAELREHDRQVMEQGQARYYEEVVPSPVELRHYMVIKFPLYDEGGQVEAVCGIATDVTDMKRVTERLRDSEAFLNMAIDAARIGTWSWDCVTDEVRWSETVPAIMGVSESEFDGRFQSVHAAVHADDWPELQKQIARALEPGAPDYRAEFRVVGPGGRLRWVEARGLVVPDEQGRPLRMTGTVADITERKELEVNVLQAQKVEVIGRLAGGVAHDFNNLLTSILGYADLLRQRVSGDDEAELYLSRIVDASRRGGGLTQQLLGYARKQVAQPEVLELNLLVRRVVQLMRRLTRADIEIICDLEPDLGAIRADPVHVEQVLMNLWVNAQDAMERGGRLALRTLILDITDRTQAPTGMIEPGSYIALQVSDTGHGIPPEILPHVFDPFFTTKPVGQGTGLGLSTSLGVIEQGGGHIQVQSETGVGTTFTVLFRSAEPQQVRRATEPPTAEQLGGRETILFVEDDGAIRDLVATSLARYGYRILRASNGVEALTMAREHAVDLLVSDVVMPRMTGTELAAVLTEEKPHVRILLTSGYAEPLGDGDGALPAGVHFLQKPYAPAVLARRIRAVLDAQ